MKKLAEVANVVPVIAKADSMTLEERERFKDVISSELQEITQQQKAVNPNFSFYPFELEEQDIDERDLNKRIRVRQQMQLCSSSWGINDTLNDADFCTLFPGSDTVRCHWLRTQCHC